MPTAEPRTPAWRRYLRFWGGNVTADVDEEIAFHVEALVAEYVRTGMTPPDARRAANARFGDTTTVARAMRELARERETAMRRTEWIDEIGRDLRVAFRQLARRRAFTTVALVTLGLGIGADTAIFSAVHGVLLHPISAPELGRLAVVRTNLPTMNLLDYQMGPGEAIDVMKRTDLFDASASWSSGSAVLTEYGEPRRLSVARTIGRFFELLGARATVGRLYRPDESEQQRHHVAVLSYGLWQELGADRSIVGRTLQLNGQSYQVVGVGSPTLDYPRSTDLYLPAPVDARTAQNRSTMIWNVVGRIKSGLSFSQFDAGIRSETARWHQTPGWGYAKAGQYLNVFPLADVLAGQLRPVLLVLLAAVGFVLLIACANVASLQLVHGVSRSRELAVRAALGAGRGTLVRQLLVENLVLSVGGGLLGVLVGVVMLSLLRHAGAADMPALADVHLDGAALAFAAATTMIAALLFGLAPALRGGRVNLHDTLKESTRGSSLGGRRNWLLRTGVVAQIALTLVLLLGSGLMIRSLAGQLAQDPGFRSEHIVTLRTTAAGRRYATGPALGAFYTQLTERVRALPGVSGVGLVSDLPFSGSSDSSPFRIIGREKDPNGPELHANMHAASDEYFATMGIPLLRGRTFGRSDVKDRPIAAIVDAQFARTFFPNEDPIGKQINQGPDATIVGVVGTISQNTLGEPAKATVYYSTRQFDWYASLYITVRSALPTTNVASMVRGAVTAIDPGVPVYDVRTLDERISASVAPRRLAMTVLTALAGLSLFLAVFGLYGVISYAVSQRTVEFGIRAALGAQPGQIRALVVRQGLWLAQAGVAIGVAAAVLATRAMSALLFGISPRDPATFVAAAVLVTVVAVLASYLPARRATRIDLADTLRGG